MTDRAIKRYDLINVPCHGGWDSYGELQEVEDGDWVRYDDHAAEVERLSTEGLQLDAPKKIDPDLFQIAVRLAAGHADASDAWALLEEVERLRGQVAELERLRARVAELEEDRQAERDRILGARVREIARQHDARPHDARLDLYGFAREVMRAMEDSDG